MRAAFLGAVLIGLLVGGSVLGIRLLRAGGGTGATPPEPAGNPAADLAQRFADAWQESDYAALYLLLHPASQAAYAAVDLEAAYRDFARETTQIAIAVSVTEANEAGARFDVRLQTAYFGTLEYSTTVRFARDESGNLRVRWQPDAIHPAMTGGRVLRSEIQRPRRGAIYDRNGEPLAITRDVRVLGLDRSAIRDETAVRAALQAFGFPREAIDRAFASPLPRYYRVEVGVVPDERTEEANRLVLETPGLVLAVEERRVHPLGPAAAHIVGYTRELTAGEAAAMPGRRPGDRVGAAGLEAAFDELLAGRVGAALRVVGPGGTVLQTLAEQPYVPAQDIHTTLDARVQRAAFERLGGRAGAVVVLDPRTNELLAVVSSPAFDPDAFERGDAEALAAYTNDPAKPLTNRALHGLYSAGSTFKLVTGAAGLASGLVSPATRLDCGAVWYGVDPPRRNWEGARGPLTIAEGLMRSCNPVFYEIGLRLYNERPGFLAEMARRFGFGQPSGTPGLDDAAGLVPDDAWKRRARGEPWYPGDEVNLAIGQGDLLVTPLQLANAYSAFLARQLRRPVLLAGGAAEPIGEPLPLTDAQWAHLYEGLRLVTGPNGTAASAFWALGYTDFGGKSGTAEDAELQQHVLFVAFAPVTAPAALAAVVLDDGASGSLEAGPIARDAVLAALGR
ncbi:Peptidoglycan D,D-transpeptidase MrdA [bacterium HR29]|jgi:penicillin-binding protein 2|nr:Peptidoglycan D,D-transpeptidase MrdA [bacterium HR29]